MKENWKKWIGKRLLRIGYWPQYTAKEKDWVQKIDPVKIINQLVKGGFQVVEWSVPETYSFLNVGSGVKHPATENVKRDILRELIEEAKKKGIKVMVGVPLDPPKEWCVKHPEVFPKGGVGGFPCVNNPIYREEFTKYIKALVISYDIDGIMFDGAHPHLLYPRDKSGKIICRYCAEKYKQQTGKNLPYKEDWNDLNWKRYVRWRFQCVNEFLIELKKAIKSVAPHIYVTINSNINFYESWQLGGDTDTIYNATDGMFFETMLDSRNLLEASLNMKLGWAALEGRPPEIYHKTFNPPTFRFAYGRPTYTEVATLAWLGLAHGASVGIHSSMDKDGNPHSERTKVYIKVGKEISREMKYLVNAKPIYYCGIHFSQNTRDFYGGVNASAYLSSFVGAEQALTESHILTGVLLDHQMDLKHLQNYKLIVLPNSACLSQKQVEAVKEYVQNGGKLLATGETSLYDEKENRRKNFGLSEVFGVDFKGVDKIAYKEMKRPPLSLKRMPFILHTHNLTKGLEKYLFSEHPWFKISARESAEIIGTWAIINEERANEGRPGVNGWINILGDSGTPCVVANRFGKGKVVYISSDVTGDYFYENNTSMRTFIFKVANWLASSPIRIKAPKSITATVCQQKNLKRLIIHLVNYMVLNKSSENIVWSCVDPDNSWPLKSYNPKNPSRFSGRPDGIKGKIQVHSYLVWSISISLRKTH